MAPADAASAPPGQGARQASASNSGWTYSRVGDAEVGVHVALGIAHRCQGGHLALDGHVPDPRNACCYAHGGGATGQDQALPTAAALGEGQHG